MNFNNRINIAQKNYTIYTYLYVKSIYTISRELILIILLFYFYTVGITSCLYTI